MVDKTFTPSDTTGTVAAGRNWNAAGNWTPAGIPASTDTVTINSNFDFAPIISGGTADTAASITLNAPTSGSITTSNLIIGGADYVGPAGPASAGPGFLTVGTITDNAGGIDINGQGSTLTAGDIAVVGAGGATMGGGGIIDVTGTILNSGVIIADGSDYFVGPLTLTAGAITGGGSIDVHAGSTLELGVSTSELVHIVPSDTAAPAGGVSGPAVLALDSAGFVGTLALDPTTRLDLILPAGATTATVSGTTLTIGGAAPESITLGGTGYSGAFTAAGAGGRASFALSPVCFARGTRIATEAGEVAVEDLRAGDQVRLAGGGLAPIVWIGRRKLDCARHPHPRQVWPVRVQAGAFAPGLPARDLWLSPQHAIYAEGVLIPAQLLLNGRTVTQEPVARVEYFHVELARHDLLLAEGLATESYLDTGDRASFENAGGAMVLHPDFARLVWDGRACAELKVTGPELAAVRAQLAQRAEATMPEEQRAAG